MALPATGLIMNLSADSLNLADGQPVGTWTDQSGAGNSPAYIDDGQQAVAPLLRTGRTPNGSPAVVFYNGSLVFSSNTQFNASTGAELFIFVRVYSDASDNSGLYQFGGNDWTYYTYTDGYIYDGSFTNSRYSFYGVSPSSWHIYNVSHDGTSRVSRVDGTIVTANTVPFTAPSQAAKSTMRIGRAQGVPWQGEIAGFICYNRVLTAGERTSVHSYLTSKYVTASDPQTASIPAASLNADMPLAVSDAPVAQLPAASLTIDTGGTSTAPADVVQLPAATLTVDMSVSVSAAALTLSTPVDGATVQTTQPTFVVALTAPDPAVVYTVEVQYDDNSAFTSPTTLTSGLTAADGGLFLTATVPATAATYWRARLLLGTDEQTPWTLPRSFTVNATVPAVTLPVTWTVTPTADRPVHLWHFDPPGPLAGDTVTIYGQGFPATGTLSYGDTVLPTTSWQLVPATTGRTIDGDTVTCEHYEITFTAPADNGPGGALTVEA